MIMYEFCIQNVYKICTKQNNETYFVYKIYTRYVQTNRGRGTSMPFVDSVPMCPKCTKASVKEWVLETDDGKAYAKANEKRLKAAGVMFKRS